jgi:L-asparaginase
MAKKRVLVIGTGGTIAAKMHDRVWRSGEVAIKTLLRYDPRVHMVAELESLDLFKMDSSNLQPENWITLAEKIKEKYTSYDGFIITHGTDTMHYTASALSFLLQNLSKSVILTGSQVPPDKISSDASRNLLDSLRVATEKDMHEVLVVFNGKIIRGNRAKKFRELEFDAFDSIGMLPLGVIEHDIRVTGEHYNNTNTDKGLKFFGKLEKNVCILKITPGFNPKIISWFIANGYKGIVLEGFGAGNVPIGENSLIPEIKKAVKAGVPVVVSSQCAIGFSWMSLYECGKRALDAGAIPGYDMISETAMTKLMWILGNYPKANMEQIRWLFLKDVVGEISKLHAPEGKRIWEYAL